MFINVERYVKFLAKTRLTQQEFLLLYLIKFKKKEVMKMYMQAFPHPDGSMIGKENRQHLIDKGYLVHNAEMGMGIEAYETTEKFDNLYVTDTWEAMEELWVRYPGFVKISGRDAPLTNTDKYQLQLLYGERIGYDIAEHREVLKDVEWGVKNNLIKQNIESFVRSQMWEKIRPLRLQSEAKQMEVGQQEDTREFQ